MEISRVLDGLLDEEAMASLDAVLDEVAGVAEVLASGATG
jgi:hypothetical protein